MKLYKFYKKLGDNIKDADELSMTDKYPLYAFTNKKKMYEEFIATRNMDMFIVIIDDIEPEEFVKFSNSITSAKLDYYKYTSFQGYDAAKKFIDVKVLSTWNEKEITSAMLEDSLETTNGELDWNRMFPLALCKKYIKALDKLEFMTHWRLYGRSEGLDDYYPEFNLEDYDDYSSPNVRYDELHLFTHLYSDTFK